MNIRKVFTIFKKEIIDIARDKRALLISVIIPVVMFPLSFGAMNANLKASKSSSGEGIRIAVSGNNFYAEQVLKAQTQIRIVESSDPLADLGNGSLHSVVHFGINKAHENVAEITVDNLRQSSIESYVFLSHLFQSTERTVQKTKLSIVRKSIEDEPSSAGKLLLSVMLPILFFVFSASTPMAVAADLVAGEKERNTLEPLLCVPVSRMEILAGKFFAVVVTGIVGSCAFMSGIAISYCLTPEAFGVKGMVLSMDVSPFIVILLCAVVLVMILGSMELCISIFARSIKEAQILFLPLLIVSMGCGYATIILDVKNIPLAYRFIPLVNIGVLIRELSVGIMNFPFIALSFFECGTVIAIVFVLSLRMFSSEKYIFRG